MSLYSFSVVSPSVTLYTQSLSLSIRSLSTSVNKTWRYYFFLFPFTFPHFNKIILNISSIYIKNHIDNTTIFASNIKNNLGRSSLGSSRLLYLLCLFFQFSLLLGQVCCQKMLSPPPSGNVLVSLHFWRMFSQDRLLTQNLFLSIWKMLCRFLWPPWSWQKIYSHTHSFLQWVRCHFSFTGFKITPWSLFSISLTMMHIAKHVLSFIGLGSLSFLNL